MQKCPLKYRQFIKLHLKKFIPSPTHHAKQNKNKEQKNRPIDFITIFLVLVNCVHVLLTKVVVLRELVITVRYSCVIVGYNRAKGVKDTFDFIHFYLTAWNFISALFLTNAFDDARGYVSDPWRDDLIDSVLIWSDI